MVIDHLDELAVRQPSQRAWDEFQWPELQASPSSDIKLAYIQGRVVDMGVHMPPVQFYVTD